jgi:YrbI family 3-deoxy-D-manno-octulosonate 8-phosphate phosphatase
MQPLLDAPGISEPFNAPRQSLPQIWWQIGMIDAVRAEVIRSGSMTGSRVLPLKVDAQYAVDIDGENALRYAEMLAPSLIIVRPGPMMDWGRIKLLVLDVDGTLTTGSMFYSPDGEALKCFHTHDGRGISMVQERGIIVVIVSQENTGFTAARAAKLGIGEVHVGVRDKLLCLREISGSHNVALDEIAFVGDDMGDVAAMMAVREVGGISCAPADARPEALAAASYVCPTCGGHGAVRDVCDRILTGRSERC